MSQNTKKDLTQSGTIVQKPWGLYKDLFRSQKLVFKQIRIDINGQLSLQQHKKRAEIWHIHEGLGVMTINDDHFTVQNGDTLNIDIMDIHRIKNIGNGPLIIYEVQLGDCDENDIVRLDDVYGRK